MTASDTPDAIVRLRGHPPTGATFQYEHRSRKKRLTSSLTALLGFWLLIPVVALVPPHIPWALLAFVSGMYFGYRRWIGEYKVRAFSAPCPRCNSPLAIKTGSLIRLPNSMDCFSCHHNPILDLN
jgi:hypothetical protein